MRLIPLTRGQFAKVDDGDAPLVSQFKWYAQDNRRGFYAARRDGGGALIYMHRFLNKTPDGFVTDHVDGDGLNNQRGNLRTATQPQNMMNRHGKKGGTSRAKGVWAVRTRWRAAIRLDGRLHYLGYFATEAEASAAYGAAAARHFGDFARTTKGEVA